MAQLTKNQHYVPETYLKSWCDERGKLAVYDKITTYPSSPAPRGTLYEEYYYEDPQTSPTNELENQFGVYETAFGEAKKLLQFTVATARTIGQSPVVALAGALTARTDRAKALKQFAALSYCRTPAALTAMREQLAADGSADAAAALARLQSPYALNKDAFDSTLLDRFSELSIFLGYSEGGRLHTGDWPCYPLGGGEQHANFGFDIGNHPAAFAGMAITPQIYMLLVPDPQKRKPPVLAREMGPDLVHQANEIVERVAERRIVR